MNGITIQGRVAWVAGLLLAASGATLAGELDDRVMYGFNRETGEMYRHRFDEGYSEGLGVLRDEQGNAMVGIDAAVFGYGFSNIYAFWFDGDAAEARLVYVDPETGKPQLNPHVIDGGPITGAVAVKREHERDGRIYGVQSTEGVLGVYGDANINPNTAGQMEFTLELAEAVEHYGDRIGRWDLQAWGQNDVRQPFSDLAQFGGQGWVRAKRLQIRPKGSARKESFHYLDEANIEVTTRQDGNIFDIVAHGEPMLVYLWNAADSGAAMGDWYVRIEAAPAEGVSYTGPSRLVEIDHGQATVSVIGELSRMYDGLTSSDGQVFFATSHGAMYVIDARDPDDVREHLIAETNAAAIKGLDYAGRALMGFDAEANRLHRFWLSHSEVATSPPIDVSMSECGTIVFSPDPLEIETYD